MTKKANMVGLKTIEDLFPNGLGGRSWVTYDGKDYKVIAADFYEQLIAIDECEDGESICWKRSESIDKGFNK